MTEPFVVTVGWEQAVNLYCECLGENRPHRRELDKFVIQPHWLNGKVADFHHESHAAEVLVWVNALRERLLVGGKLFPVLDGKLWRDALNAAAIGHDLEVTDEAANMNSEAYRMHGFYAAKKLPIILNGVVDPLAADFAAALCFWHVPPDELFPRSFMKELRQALWILKDADGVTRISRFSSNHQAAFDSRFVRFSETLELLPMVKELGDRIKGIDESDPRIGFNRVLDESVAMRILKP